MLNEFCLQAGTSHQVVTVKEQGAQIRRKSFEWQVDKADLLLSFGRTVKPQSLGLLICKMGIKELLPPRAALTTEHGESLPFSSQCVVSAW